MIKSTQQNVISDRFNRFSTSSSNLSSFNYKKLQLDESFKNFDYLPKDYSRVDRNTARRNDLDRILQHIYNGKTLPWANDDQMSSKDSESSFINDSEYNTQIRSLQRELTERDMDIQHLQKEIQELRNEKKLPIFRSSTTIDKNEIEIEELRNELRLARDLIIKLQSSNTKGFEEKQKLRDYEKQLRNLTNQNETLKQQCQHNERTIEHLKRDNEELEEKVRQLIKRNDDLFVQEFHLLRADVKTLKERNENLIEENILLNRRSSTKNPQNKFSPCNVNRITQHSYSTTESQINEQTDSEISSVDRSGFSVNSRQSKFDGANQRRPFVPKTINELHLNDIVKFSRPEGKVSKGFVKYIGSLPDRVDSYLGLELEEEDSKHDGVFQGQRFFQCKPNKGVFVSFNKIIFAWR